MEKFAIYSRNIVTFDSEVPVHGVVVVEGELISQVIRLGEK